MSLASLFDTGNRRQLSGTLYWVIKIYAALIAAAVIYTTTITYVDLFSMTIVFLGAMLSIAFLFVGAAPHSHPSRPSLLDWGLSVVAFACGIYFFLEVDRIAQRIALFDPLTPADQVFGTALLLLTLEATRRTVGFGLTAIVLIFLAYNLFGHLLPGIMGHGYIGYDHFLDIMMFTTDAVFGVPLRVAATYAFLFVLFGTVLAKAGGADFFFNLAAAVSGSRPGGPAKIALVSSGLYGTISGSPTSDVVTTGSVTIPMMKRLGYSARLAGGIEVAASTGGSLLPPVMGSAAFIMAEFTAIPYRDVAVAAAIPALLYYLCLYLQVHFLSLRRGLAGLDRSELPPLSAAMRDGGLFLVPLVVLVAALLAGYSPTMVAAFGALGVIAVAQLRKSTRLGPKRLFECLADTTLRTLPVVGACAAAGLVIGGLSMTGLAGKFADLVLLLSNDIPFLALIIAALLTILLGMGMPTPSAYILAAVMVGPTLQSLGFTVLGGNLFLLYFACLSALTPPVAVAAFAAASIADANPLEIAVSAVRMAITAFIVPFAFIYGPGLLLQGSALAIAFNVVTAIVGVLVMAAGVEGWLRARIDGLARWLLLAAGVALIFPFVQAFVAAVALIALALVLSADLRRQLTGGLRPSSRPQGLT